MLRHAAFDAAGGMRERADAFAIICYAMLPLRYDAAYVIISCLRDMPPSYACAAIFRRC